MGTSAPYSSMQASKGLFCRRLSPGGRGRSVPRSLSSVLSSMRLPHKMKSFSSSCLSLRGSFLILERVSCRLVCHEADLLTLQHSFSAGTALPRCSPLRATSQTPCREICLHLQAREQTPIPKAPSQDRQSSFVFWDASSTFYRSWSERTA